MYLNLARNWFGSLAFQSGRTDAALGFGLVAVAAFFGTLRFGVNETVYAGLNGRLADLAVIIHCTAAPFCTHDVAAFDAVVHECTYLLHACVAVVYLAGMRRLVCARASLCRPGLAHSNPPVRLTTLHGPRTRTHAHTLHASVFAS